jgi:O-antigen/teichoic acid export membrane protein
MHSDNGRNERNESHLERYDRNLIELLQEVRVAQTGVQVLFAFLLGLAFTSRLGQATPLQRVDYLVTLISSAMAALLLIAPTSHHRLLFRRGDKAHLVTMANRYVIAGLAGVAVSLIGAVLLVSDLLFGGVVAMGAAGLAAACCLITWYGMPLARRRALTRASPTEGPTDTGRAGNHAAAREPHRVPPGAVRVRPRHVQRR